MAKKLNGHGAGHNSGSQWQARVYNVIEIDPECGVFTTLWQKEKLREAELAMLAGLSPSTVGNLVNGKTKRPQHATFAKMARAMGYRYRAERDERPDYDAEIPKARAEYKVYKSTLAKRKARKKRNAAG